MKPSMHEEHMALAADIVAAYVSNNSIQAGELPVLIHSVHASLRKAAAGLTETPVEAPKEPPVSIKKSVTNDYIICFEDGKKFKSLKRHLSTSYDLTPAAYRTKWGLPPDYPMVAPGYSATRSELAKAAGLGNVRPALEAVKPSAKVVEGPTKKRTRPKKAA